MTTIRIEAPGYEHRTIALWHGEKEGHGKAAYDVAKEAARQATGFALAVGRLVADPNTTRIGKQAPARTHATERLRALAGLAKQANEARDILAKRRAMALQATPPDAATAVYDVAIAQYLRGLSEKDAAKFLHGARLGSASGRIIEAVARLPAELCGMSDAQHREVLDHAAARKDPEGWQAISEAAAAWENAAEAIEAAIHFVERGAPTRADNAAPPIPDPELPYKLDATPTWRSKLLADRIGDDAAA